MLIPGFKISCVFELNSIYLGHYFKYIYGKFMQVSILDRGQQNLAILSGLSPNGQLTYNCRVASYLPYPSHTSGMIPHNRI